jgi:hypothetical protein
MTLTCVCQPPGRGPVPGTRLIEKIIYRAAVSQSLRTTALNNEIKDVEEKI